MPTAIQFLRTSDPGLRPFPLDLSDGMPMVNTNESEPGLYFRLRNNSLMKVGPCHIGPNPPNNSGAGFQGLCIGEQWLDTSGANTLRIWDGSNWSGLSGGTQILEDLTIEGTLQVQGNFLPNNIVDSTGSGGQNGQVLTSEGTDLRWKFLRTDNVIYVSKDGDDANDGLSPTSPKLTVKSGVDVATAGDVVHVGPGDYTEDNPIEIREGVAVQGENMYNTTIYSANNGDLFWVNNGCYISDLSFRSVTPVSLGRAVVCYPPSGAGPITRSPYVQNCTNFIGNSTGMQIDGTRASGLRSMVTDSYTQYNEGGVGVHISNNGVAQIVSMFTICCDKSCLVESGGNASITNSNSDFGNFGLVADGVGSLAFSGQIRGGGQENGPYSLENMTSTTRPYVGQVVTIGDLYFQIRTIDVSNGGSGYTTPPTVEVTLGSGPNAIKAQGVGIISNGAVVGIDLISNGQGYTAADTPLVSFIGGGGVGAAGIAIKDPIYYAVESATPVVGGRTTITLTSTLPYTPSNGDQVEFYPISRIISNSHCFEFVGSGTDITTCLPAAGGVPVQGNEVVQINGGKVAVTSTDHLGNFRVGEQFVINQDSGTITGAAFTKAIISTVIPYIFALS